MKLAIRKRKNLDINKMTSNDYYNNKLMELSKDYKFYSKCLSVLYDKKKLAKEIKNTLNKIEIDYEFAKRMNKYNS